MVDFPPDHVPLPAGQAPAMNPERLARAMGRWRRRSRVIHFWRRALPLLMLLILGGVLGLIALCAPSASTDNPQRIRISAC